MPCFSPLQAFFVPYANEHGVLTRKAVFSKDYAGKFRRGEKLPDSCVSLPCGRCMGCRLERSRQWALRMLHESKSHEDNCFVTLTFDDENLAKMCPDGSLVRKHVQDFMKRLRTRFVGRFVRVFYCGEYGEALNRPHYHLCLFNLDFDDKVFYKKCLGFDYFNSAVLSSLWPYGHAVVTSFSFETAAYVARYCTKKVNGEKADDHYQGRLPEFCGMSLKPGIGRLWFDKYAKSDLIPHDTCVVRGALCKPPRYYDKLRERDDPVAFAKAKEKRVERALLKSEDSTYARLDDQERCMSARVRLLVRGFERGH